MTPLRLTLVTCTRDRPEAFALTELWISRQTIKPHEWLVFDDGNEPLIVLRKP